MKRIFALTLFAVMILSVALQAQTSSKSKAKSNAVAAPAPVSAATTQTAKSSSPVANAALQYGDRLFKRFAFVDAIAEYKAAIKKDPSSIEAKEKLVRTYLMLNDYTSAEPVLQELATMPSAKANNILLYGLSLRAAGKYKEAAEQFNNYALLNPSDFRASELASGLSRMEELAKDNGTHKVENSKGDNSDASDFGVSYYRNNGIIFSSNKGKSAFVGRTDSWTEHKYYDLYSSENGKVGLLSKKKVINSKYHEGPVTFTKDFSEMIFTRNNYLKKTGKSKDRIVKLKLYSAKFDSAAAKFAKPTELPLNSSEYSVAHPTLSKDGKRLYFVSDMPGGYGETDVYVSYKEGETWGPPVNLGKNVNTPGREVFPHIADDGTLYFATDARLGLGGLDVYSSLYANGEWGNVTNLGAPVNSPGDDFNYILDNTGKAGYLVSNRAGGAGDDDIYKFTRFGVKICGTVVDAETNLPIEGAEVKMKLVDKTVASKNTDSKGGFCHTADPGKEYLFEASKSGYENNSATISVKLTNPSFTIPLTPAKKDTPVALAPVQNLNGLKAVDPKDGVTLVVCTKERNKGNLGGAEVEVEDKSTGAKSTCVTTDDCKCKFVIEPNKEYHITASKQGYSTATKTISTKGEKPGTTKLVELTLDVLREGLTVNLENIYYDLDKWNIRPEAAKELNNLVKLMNQYPNMEIELSSHTDSRASDQYNLILSARRANSCVEFLRDKGIDVKRLLAVGYGETRLKNKCSNGVQCTNAQHQANRRTEFKILKLK
jgi:outer membrane protein OmpA-like peptidoglycan-associated protein/tetratricopeptide (TPR) repeat protein